ncbi:MAG: FAD-dependent urate hydroxylase [Chlamydiae bacterium]|nr:FAD-dependent urate hydroxylase [Chlamydiota bacterium]
MKKNAIILGGGISGLAAAIKSKNLGYHVTLIEKKSICSHLGGGIDIHPNGVKILFSLGIESQLRKLTSSNTREITISNGKGKTLNRVPLSIFEKDPAYPLMSFFRQDLLKILFEQADIDEVYENTECTDIWIKEDKVEVQLDGKNPRISGDILIGADGINSIARKTLFPHVQKQYLGHLSIGGSISRKYYRHNYVHDLQRTCVVFPCTQESCHTVMFMPLPEGFLKSQTSSSEERVMLLHGWSDEVDEILNHLDSSNRFAVESYEIPPLDFHAKGRVFLVGDAAHAMSPLGALATNLALEDVEHLNSCLSITSFIDEAAYLYNKMSIPRAKKYRDFSHRFLLPPFTSHGPEDYTRRIARIEQQDANQVFEALTSLTQENLEAPTHQQNIYQLSEGTLDEKISLCAH